jgi:predicted ATPase
MNELSQVKNQTITEGIRRRFIKKIKVKGYKLYDELSIELDKRNIIAGPNGSGKSAFLSIFDMLHYLAIGEFQLYVERQGGAAELLHGGPDKTKEIELEVWFEDENTMDKDGYAIKLVYDHNRLLIAKEELLYEHSGHLNPIRKVISKYFGTESVLRSWAIKNKDGKCYVYQDFVSSTVYHFCDTGWTSRMKGLVDIYQADRLWWDGGNIAAYLYYLQMKYPETYQEIVNTVRKFSSSFVDFHLKPNDRHNPPSLRLEWVGQDNRIHSPQSLSDGTLRFICLSTLLLQPAEKMPSIILIDEPEIGLHPSAIEPLNEMIKNASKHRTVIVATHSEALQKRSTLSEYLWGY